MIPQRLASGVQPTIEFHIDELVLHGVPLTNSQGRAVKAAMESELARLVAEQGVSHSTSVSTPHLTAGSIQLSNNSQPANLGHQIAQAIFGGLKPTGTSTNHAHSIKGASS